MRTALGLVLFAFMGQLAGRDDKEDVEKFTRQLNAKDEKDRIAALEGLTKMGSKAKPALREVCDRLVDASPKVIQAAFAAVEKLDPELYKPLSGALLETDPRTQGKHLYKLILLREKVRPASTAILAKVQAESKTKNNGGVEFFDVVWAAAPDDPTSIATIKTIAGPTDPNPLLRNQAIRYLTKWAGADDDRRNSVVPLVKNCLSEPQCTVVGAWCAGELGKAATDLLPQLKELKLSKSASIRNAATTAVEKIEKP